jgi:hypothetical protein
VITAEVSGTVLLDGKPLAGVTVAFFPQSERADSSWVGRGTTDSAGRYTLVGPEGLAGAVVGTNCVVVLPPKTLRTSDATSTTSLARVVPARYSLRKSSPLAVEVRADDSQTIDLSLTSK